MKHYLITTFLLITLLSGCSSKKIKNELNKEISNTPTIQSEAELYNLEKKTLNENINLSEKQKASIQVLMLKTKSTNISLDDEIMKTKAVLFQTLIKKENNKYKIKNLESQLIKLNRRKVRNSLNAYKEAKNILGKSDIPLEKTLQLLDQRTIKDF